jgi:hypothetical protein
MMRRRGPGLVGGVARTAVIAGTATAVSGRVARRQNQRWANQEQEQYAQQQAAQQSAPPPEPQYAEPAPPAEPDYAVEIRRLAAMRDQGLITQDEFDAKKKQLLGI